MKITLQLRAALGGDVRTVTRPAGESAAATVAGACPVCQAEPFLVSGCGMRVGARDEYHADAVSLCCAADVGLIVAKVSTLFGIEEDEAVLIHGRARVY